MEMGWLETAGFLVAAVGVFVWANLAGRRPSDPLEPRLWSPVLVMGLAVVVAMVMLAHMVTLATGQPFRGGGF